MKVIRPSYEILTEIKGDELRKIEEIARVCYKSEGKITENSYENFIKNLIKRGHEAMLEHSMLSVKFICDRGISHQIVRHRMASYAQESTRIHYGRDGVEFILPTYLDYTDINYSLGDLGTSISKKKSEWEKAMTSCEETYKKLIELGVSPREARNVLPMSLKTELVMTANYREWRHFLRLRTAKDAHPEIRRLTVPLLLELKDIIPIIFDDIL